MFPRKKVKDQSWDESAIPIFDDWKSAANDLLQRKWELEALFTEERVSGDHVRKAELVEKKRKVSDGQIRQVTIDETGEEVGDARLKEAGFEVDAVVVRKQDKACATIHSLLEKQVILILDGKKFKIDREPFLKEWKLAASKQNTKKEPLSPEQYGEWKDQVAIAKIKAACVIEIASAGEGMGKVEDMFTITSKPKDVISKESHAKGKLCIPPVTTRITVLSKDDDSKPTGTLLGETSVGETIMHIYAQPPGFHYPFWMMKHSLVPEECNMEPRIQVCIKWFATSRSWLKRTNHLNKMCMFMSMFMRFRK